MAVEYFEWGGVEQNGLEQYVPNVQRLYHACYSNSSCDVLALKIDAHSGSQTIIVEFGDGTYDAENAAGIQRVERIALVYLPNAEFCWEARPLRKDFPVTIHQNHVLNGEPRCLCLYIEPWESVERSWTPELFLKRIFWWLRSSADGTIHGNDQPIEQLFFSSPYQIILPEGHFDLEANASKKLFFELIDIKSVKTKTLIASYDKLVPNDNSPFCLSVSIFLDPIENGPVEKYPDTLGELHDLLLKRGSDIVSPLKSALNEVMTEQGLSIQKSEKEFVLLLLGIPRVRNGEIEKVDVCGFIINSGFCQLGEALSVYFQDKNENRWFRWVAIGGDQEAEDEPWRLLGIEIAETKCYPNPSQIRQLSGLDRDAEGPNGIIAGVGALGGSIAEIWSRECWGNWTYVDSDIVQPHNVVRHISTRHGIGLPKSYVVDSLTSSIHLHEAGNANQHFISSILSQDPKLVASLRDSDLLIDISTTLHVPRELSRRTDVPRTVSAFITPSGNASVMLMEDNARSLRCTSLEAQYYRAILESDWGSHHLAGHTDRIWVGAGCRQMTLILSNELIQLHAATLARQIRKGVSEANARISIWDHQEESGGIVSHSVEVFPSHSQILGDWEVCWDDGFLHSAIQYRAGALPNETGGILFGVIDQKDRTITLVKACSAPINSESTPSSFSRAAYESTEILDECHKRTAEVVTYVGEWHSHPRDYGALPSPDDLVQLDFLSESLQTEGMPALMMIVADHSVGFCLNDQGIIVKV